MSTPVGDKRRYRIYLKDTGIPKVVPNVQSNPKGSVPRKPPSVLLALKPPGGSGLPNYELGSVANPRVHSAVGKSISNTSVNKAEGNQRPNHSMNSGVQNGVNSAQDKKIQNNVVNTN